MEGREKLTFLPKPIKKQKGRGREKEKRRTLSSLQKTTENMDSMMFYFLLVGAVFLPVWKEMEHQKEKQRKATPSLLFLPPLPSTAGRHYCIISSELGPQEQN